MNLIDAESPSIDYKRGLSFLSSAIGGRFECFLWPIMGAAKRSRLVPRLVDDSCRYFSYWGDFFALGALMRWIMADTSGAQFEANLSLNAFHRLVRMSEHEHEYLGHERMSGSCLVSSPVSCRIFWQYFSVFSWLLF